MDRQAARRAFADMVRRRDEELDLGRAALLLAAHFSPDLDVEPYAARLDAMAAELGQGLDRRQEPLLVIADVNRYLFGQQGFRGDHDHYYDPRNSLLNEVLDRKRGIPITLSVIYLEVTRRLGLPLAGVGFPGHFLVKYLTGEGAIFIDPFNQGMVLTEEDLRDGLARHYGASERRLDHYLATVTKRQILTRMLHNLKGVYLQRRAYDAALETINLLLTISPWNLEEIRDRGMVQVERCAYEDALADLEVYLEYAPEARDAGRVRRNVDALRRLIGVDPLV
ncbi:MAG TPA: transglutaminase-like domain-containing protein [Dehalococcoidia bacterium]